MLVTPCRCRAILFSSSLYHLLIGRATRIGPSRAAGKNFNLRGTGRNVQPGHSCFLCSQVAGRYCVAVKKGDTKIVLFVNLIVQ